MRCIDSADNQFYMEFSTTEELLISKITNALFAYSKTV